MLNAAVIDAAKGLSVQTTQGGCIFIATAMRKTLFPLLCDLQQ
jgi:hypothetical protein